MSRVPYNRRVPRRLPRILFADVQALLDRALRALSLWFRS